jgi:DNA repair exonuclease SbcCD ATPase subunit
MRSTALAYKDEDDEVPVSSQELLEANVAAISVDLKELRTEFRAAVARLDQRIDAAVAKLEADIRAMTAKAERELKEFATRIEGQLAEMRGDDKSLRERVDRNHDVLSAKIDATNVKLGQLEKNVDRIGTRLAVLIWFVGVLGTLAITLVTVGKAFKWF